MIRGASETNSGPTIPATRAWFAVVITAALAAGLSGRTLPSPLGIGLVTARVAPVVLASRRRVPVPG